MIKLQTMVDCGKSRIGGLDLNEKIMVMGSCFADNIGAKLEHAGFEVMVNPYGTLYNPVSVCNSISRLASGVGFSEEDCVEMGAGAGLICSFSHHTSFARKDKAEFLEHANAVLNQAHDFFKDCSMMVITLGTTWCYKYIFTGEIVSNCLKIDSKMFEREALSLSNTVALLTALVLRFPDKKFIFTVSPIRHFKDGAHENQLSKSTLLLAVQAICDKFPDRVDYFPAYELMMDELRDYRFYADDLVHPSEMAVNYIWEKFLEFSVSEDDKFKVLDNEKAYRRSQHRPMH